MAKKKKARKPSKKTPSKGKPKPSRTPGPKVMLFQSDDPDLAAAVATAQATLDEFRALVEQAAEPSAVPMVKTPVGEGESRVFLWLTAAQPTPTGFWAVAAQVPPGVTSLTRGQRVLVDSAAVVDWMVNDRGIIHGGFSLRVHRERLPEDQRAAFDEQIGATRFV